MAGFVYCHPSDGILPSPGDIEVAPVDRCPYCGDGSIIIQAILECCQASDLLVAVAHFFDNVDPFVQFTGDEQRVLHTCHVPRSRTWTEMQVLTFHELHVPWIEIIEVDRIVAKIENSEAIAIFQEEGEMGVR